MKTLKLLPFLFIFLSAHAGEKILFIGNSYTGQIRNTVTELFKQEKADATLTFISPGGKTLKFHSENKDTEKIIKTGNWDRIILQDQSQTPALPGYNKIFHTATDDFAKLFKSLKKKPQVYLYMTWGRRDGDNRNKKLFPNFTAMQKALTDNYTKAAKKIKATLLPVGLTFKEIHQADKALFKSLYKNDGSHPATPGAYLAASTFYSTFYKKDPTSIAWKGNIDDKTAKILLQAVKKIVK
jgi:hypothetical protein